MGIKDLIKIHDWLWEIPKSFRSDMKVPARVYASEKMLGEIFRDRSLEQLVNMATLPGIQKYALAMPDIHEGYGFCLSGNSRVLSEFGCHLPIKDMVGKQFPIPKVSIFNKAAGINSYANIIKHFKIRSQKHVFKITTALGRKIIATEDHPFYTPKGMYSVSNLAVGDRVAVNGFEGIAYEKLSNKTIADKTDILRIMEKLRCNATSVRFQIMIKKFVNRGLLPLTYDHPKLPYIIKIAAFIFGDGSMNFIGKRGDGVLHFAGKAEDLQLVKNDLKEIGYTSSKIYERKHRMLNGKLTSAHSFQVNASSLVVLLEALGVPRGKKVDQAYRVPTWILRAPAWQRRLFLASLFGCELRMPHRRLNRRGNFNAPVFPMNKSEVLLTNGRDFLKDIISLLSGFGVRVTKTNQRRRHVAQDGLVTHTLELIISSEANNLINLWSKVGFEYNKHRSFLASVAVQYLKTKRILLQEKERAIKIQVPALLRSGLSYNKIAYQLAGNPLSKRFVQDVCWKLKNGWKKITPRVPPTFPTFSEYLEKATEGLGYGGLTWDKIAEKKELKFRDYVYDITVADQNHNFIANGFLVSNCIGGVAAFSIEEGIISPGGVGYDINCGVRLLRSEKTFKEIQPYLEELGRAIYAEVPSGVGRGGRLVLRGKEFDAVLEKGARRVVEMGYGEAEDLEHLESEGVLENADASLVSEVAKSRGRDQLGTLGAGNHFVEVEVVDKILDEEEATQLGVFKDQVAILIHTGSRGLGHQIATDYIRVMMRAMPKYGISLPDRELACAPFNSPEGRNYFSAMAAGANFAWANRQLIMHEVRKAWKDVLGRGGGELDIIYDVAHNIAKIEEYSSDANTRMHANDAKKEYKGDANMQMYTNDANGGGMMKMVVHRKGATRSFPGQPVLIPGSMGTGSYLLVGQEAAMNESFGSSCHGAGRRMSRTQAKRQIRGSELKQELNKRGIVINAGSLSGIAEEAPEAYKDVDEVVEVVHQAGIAKKVARFRPVAVVKG